MLRSHKISEVDKKLDGKKVMLAGWVVVVKYAEMGGVQGSV